MVKYKIGILVLGAFLFYFEPIYQLIAQILLDTRLLQGYYVS